MVNQFDPLQEWLGIAPDEQPPHYYRLLGLEPFESDPAAIERAAERQTASVRSHQQGEHAQAALVLQNKIAKARSVLLNSAKRVVYDEQLRSKGLAAPPRPAEPSPDATPPVANFWTSRPVILGGAMLAAGVLLLMVAGLIALFRGGNPATADAESDETAVSDDTGSSDDAPPDDSDDTAPAPEPPRTDGRPAGVPDEAIAWQGNWYLFPEEQITLIEALQVAEDRQGRLLVISAAEENAFVAQHVRGPTNFGLVKLADADWINSLGRTPKYTNWHTTARHFGSMDFVAVIGKDGRWTPEPIGDIPVRVAFEWGDEKPDAGAAPTGSASAALVKRDSWSPSDGSVTYRKAGDTWTLTSTKRPNQPLRESSRTNDYVELLDPQRDVQWRLYANWASFKNRPSPRWAIAFSGGWRGGSGDATGGLATSPDKPRGGLPPGEGYALRFEGRDCVELLGTQPLADIGRDFTIELWYKLDTHSGTGAERTLIPRQQLFTMSAQAAGWSYAVESPAADGAPPTRTHVVRYYNQNGEAGSASRPEPDGPADDWKHLAISSEVRDATWSLTIFVNGRTAGQLAPWGEGRMEAVRPAAVPLRLGVAPGDPPGVCLHGLIRAFRLSSRGRYRAEFMPPATLERDADTVALLDFSRTDTEQIADVTGNQHAGRLTGVKWVSLRDESQVVAMASTKPEPMSGPPPVVAPPTPPSAEKPPAAIVRQDVPPEDAREKSLADIRQTLKDEFDRAKNTQGRLALAKLLVDNVRDEKQAPTQYAMLMQARDLAAEAGDVKATLHAVDELDRRFAIDLPQVKFDAFKMLAAASTDTGARRSLAQTAFDGGSQSAAADNYDLAQSYLTLALDLARKVKDPELLKQTQSRRKETDEAKARWERAEAARKTLADTPDDAEANSVLGRFLCFQKGDWANGLPHLVKGSDSALAKAATSDLKEPEEDKLRVDLADAWFAWGEGTKGYEQNGAWVRAQTWYQKAEPALTGAAKGKVKKRLDELALKVVPIDKGPLAGGALRLPWLDAPVGDVRAMSGQGGDVVDLSVARTGRMLAAIEIEGMVRVWELASGRQLQRIMTHRSGTATVAITPDERFLVSNLSADSLGVWNVQTGAPAGKIPTRHAAADLAFSPDGRRLAWSLPIAARTGPNIGVWDLTANRVFTVLQSQGLPHALRFAPDSRQLVVGDRGTDFFAEIWSPPRPQPARRLTGQVGPIQDVAFSPDGRFVAAASGGKVVIWRAASGEEVHSLSISGNSATVDFTGDSRRVVTGGEAPGSIAVWDVADGKLVEELKPSRPGGFVLKVVCLPDARGAVSGHQGGAIRVWRLPD